MNHRHRRGSERSKVSDQTQPSATDEPKIPGPISLSKIEITKVVDIIGTKQTQYYA